MSSAKAKAQNIIDQNGVGMLHYPIQRQLLLVAQTLTLPSRLLQVVLPLLQGHQGAALQVRRQVLRPRARPDW